MTGGCNREVWGGRDVTGDAERGGEAKGKRDNMKVERKIIKREKVGGL